MSLESEVERIVVRLVGDGSNYEAMLKAATVATERWEGSTAKLIAAESRVNQLLEDGARVRESVKTSTERYHEKLDELNDLYSVGAISAGTHEKAVKQLNDAYGQGKTKLQSYASELQAVGFQLTAVGATITGVFGSIGHQALNSAGQFEQTTIAFDTMLGSAAEAQRTLEDLTEFAALTPFEMPEIEQAARGLLQFGERGDELMKTLNNLGNAASGTSTDFGMVALIYNQIRGVGKLLTQDFRQLSTRGILSLDDLAKHFGKTLGEAQAMLSGGKITFEDVQKIFDKMSSEGGRFADLMERQSKSYLGLLSTLSDSINLTKRAIGQEMLPFIKPIIQKMDEWVNVVRNLPKPFKALIGVVIAAGVGIGILLTTVGGLTLALGALSASVVQVSGLMTKLGFSSTFAAGGMKLLVLSAAKFALLAAATVYLYKFTKAVYEGDEAIKALNRAMKIGNQRNEEWANRFKKTTQDVLEQAQELSTPKAKSDFLLSSLEKANKELEGYRASMKGAEKRVEELNTTWNNMTGNLVLEEAREELSNTSSKIALAEERVSKLTNALQEVDMTSTGSEALDSVIDSVDSTTAALMRQVDTFKMTNKEIAIYDLMMAGSTRQAAENKVAMMGVYTEQLKQLEAQKLAKEQSKQLQAEVVSLTTSLQEQIATFHLSSGEAQLRSLALRGATQDELAAAKGAMERLDAMRKEFDLMEEGKRLMEQYKTPQQQFKEGQAKLQKLLEKGGITYDVYKKALKDLHDQTREDYSIDMSVKGVEGVEAGTAAAMARLNEYKAGITDVPGLDLSDPRKVAEKTEEYNKQRHSNPQRHILTAYQRDEERKNKGPRWISPGERASTFEKHSKEAMIWERMANGIEALVNLGKNPDTVQIAKADLDQ